MKGLVKLAPLLTTLAAGLTGGALAQTAAAAPKVTLETVNTAVSGAQNSADTAWMIVATALVMLMTPGLAFFYGGLSRGKAVLNTMMMSFVALGVVAIVWVVAGYTIAFGSGGNAFIGGFGNLFLNGITPSSMTGTIPTYLYMLFQMMFAVITPALISGALLDRMKFGAYVAFIALWSLLVYAPLAHMVWSSDGIFFKAGALDFAGGTVVHMSSGVSALVAALMLGARSKATRRSAIPHNIPFVLLGAALLWFGWYGFNAGSALAASGISVLAFATTTLAPAAAMLAWMAWEMIRGQKPSAVGAATGAVVGLVAITPACGYVSPMSAILIGIIGASVSFWVVQAKHRIAADDSLDVFACHGVGGTVGAILTGIFAQKAFNPAYSGGVDGNWNQLIIQLEAIGSTIVLAAVGTAVIMFIVKAIFGLRVTPQEESLGADLSAHAEEGYTNGDFGYAGSGKVGSIDSPVILSANAND